MLDRSSWRILQQSLKDHSDGANRETSGLVRQCLTNLFWEGAGSTAVGMALNWGNSVSPIRTEDDGVAWTVAHRLYEALPQRGVRIHRQHSQKETEAKKRNPSPEVKGFCLLSWDQLCVLMQAHTSSSFNSQVFFSQMPCLF